MIQDELGQSLMGNAIKSVILEYYRQIIIGRRVIHDESHS